MKEIHAVLTKVIYWHSIISNRLLPKLSMCTRFSFLGVIFSLSSPMWKYFITVRAVVTVGPSGVKVNAFLSGKMPSGSTKSMHTTLKTKTNTHHIFLQKFGNLGSHICEGVSLFKDWRDLAERKMASVRDFCCLLRVPAGGCEKRKGESPGTSTKPDLTPCHLGRLGWEQSRVAVPALPVTAAGLLAAAASKVALNKLSKKFVGANASLLLCKGLWSILVPLCFSSECLLSVFALVAPKYVQFRTKAVSSFVTWARGIVLLHSSSTCTLGLWHFPSSLWSPNPMCCAPPELLGLVRKGPVPREPGYGAASCWCPWMLKAACLCWLGS